MCWLLQLQPVCGARHIHMCRLCIMALVQLQVALQRPGRGRAGGGRGALATRLARPMTGADCPGTGSRPKTGSLSSRDGLRPKAASLVLVQLPALGPHSLVSGQTRLGACLPLVLVRAGTSTSQTRPRTDG